MEEEEREAQSAKLQELIRRGAPEDLQEANRLMKIMAGYDTRSKTDYRAKAAEEVGKIQAKARLLEERLEAFQEGDTMKDGDVFSELAAALQSAQPKIQKMCEEESDDHEAVAKLLEINDSIHRTVERYKSMKKGDMETARKIAAGAPPPSKATPAAGSSSAANELSLIDFDAEAPGTNGSSGTSAPATSQAGGIENDLLGLDIGSDSGSFGQGGGIALGFGGNQGKLSGRIQRCICSLFLRHSRSCTPFFYDPKQHRPWSRYSFIHSIHLTISIPDHHSSTPLESAISISASQTTRNRPLCCSRRPWLKFRVSCTSPSTKITTCCLER